MTQTTFPDNVAIQGSRDVAQLQVRANTVQTQPLQIWQDGSGNALAQVDSGGKLQFGDPGLLGTPTALVEANQTLLLPSAQPQRGWHSLGKMTGPVTTALTWVFNELRLLGTGGISSLQIAQRTQLTIDSSTVNATAAELRAGDFITTNAGGTSSTPIGKITGSRSTASNGTNAYVTTAFGVEGAISTDTGGNINQAAAFSAVIPLMNGAIGSLTAFSMAPVPTGGTIGTLYGLQIPSLTRGSANYAIYTNAGIVHLGDVLEIPVQATPSSNPATNNIYLYTKLVGSTPQLFIKSSSGVEYALSSGGTVTSVGLTLPPLFTVSGSPVTSAGTLNASLANQAANLVFAGPGSGSAATPGFRALAALDLAAALTSPPPIGQGTTPAAGTFSTLVANQGLTLAAPAVGPALSAYNAVINHNVNGLTGLNFSARYTPQASLSSMYGVYFGQQLYNSANNVTNAYSVLAIMSTDSTYTGTLTNAYVLCASSPTKNGSQPIGNVYGLYVEPMTAGTNNWAIVTHAGLIALGDQVTINGSADRPQLIVKANATQTSDLVQVQNSAGTVLSKFASDGRLAINSTTTPSYLTLRGSLGVKVLNVTPTSPPPTYTVSDTDFFLEIAATSTAGVTLNLPSASSAGQGRTYIFLRYDAFATTVTIMAAGSDHINGASSKTLVGAYSSLRVTTDGVSNWWAW